MRVHVFPTTCFVLLAAVTGFLGGVYSNVADPHKWDGVLVVNSGGTLVANPEGLTGEELADATIIKRDPNYIGFCGRKVLAGDSFADFPIMDCKEVVSTDELKRRNR